jgi:hypothetical protein
MTAKTSTVTDSVEISRRLVWLGQDVHLAGVGDPRNLETPALLGPLPTELNLVRLSSATTPV